MPGLRALPAFAVIFDEADTEPSNPPTITIFECQDARPCFLAATTGQRRNEEVVMGRGILLWLLGVPIPVILLLAMCSHH